MPKFTVEIYKSNSYGMTILEQILAGLQQKFTGVDTAILTRIATKKAEGVTDETKVNSIVEGISFSDVLNSYGDFRAGDASKTAVSNYEKKHNLKDGKTYTTIRSSSAYLRLLSVSIPFHLHPPLSTITGFAYVPSQKYIFISYQYVKELINSALPDSRYQLPFNPSIGLSCVI